MATLLQLDHELVRFIQKELMSLGYLDQRNSPTGRGLGLLLADDLLNSEDLVAGFVFQDPWTGHLWPRFSDHMDYADVDYVEADFPTLVLGSSGRPRRERPYLVFPGADVVWKTPTADEVLQAVEKHWRALRFRDSISDDSLTEGGPAWRSPTEPNRIAFIQEEPMPVFLTTLAYAPKDGRIDESAWYACDPMGLGANEWLRREMLRQSTKDQHLNELLVGLTPQVDREELVERTRILEQAAVEVINSRLSPRVWSLQLCDSLLAMEREHQEALLLGPVCPADKLATVMVKAAIVLEELFVTLRQDYPTSGTWRVLRTADRDFRTEMLQGIAEQVGFQGTVPELFAHMNLERIRQAADEGYGGLGPHVVASLLAARANETHPMRLAAAAQPDLLHQIARLSLVRGPSAHYNKKAITIQDIDLHVDTVYQAVRSLASIPTHSTR
ncbi:MAG: hypothetical protein GX620_00035 [Chloroflexi bacterium]|nr:hypothetical protein [Chloroflexota bacterium]